MTHWDCKIKMKVSFDVNTEDFGYSEGEVENIFRDKKQESGIWIP